MAGELGSTRTLSLAALSVAFVSLSFAMEYAGHLDQVVQAKVRFIGCWLAEDPSRQQANAADSDGPMTGAWSLRTETRGGSTYVQCHNCPAPATWTMPVVRRRLWGDRPLALVIDDEDPARLQQYAGELRAQAERVAGKGPDGETCQQSYARIEDALLERPVEIPVVGIKVTAFWAQLATALLMLVLLVEIRAGIRAALVSSDCTERWTAIDDRTLGERIVAFVWLAAVVVAPFVVDACFLATLTGYLRALGSATPVPVDLLLVAFAAALLVTSGWLAYSLLIDLLRLRAQHRLAAEPLPQPAVGQVAGTAPQPGAEGAVAETRQAAPTATAAPEQPSAHE